MFLTTFIMGLGMAEIGGGRNERRVERSVAEGRGGRGEIDTGARDEVVGTAAREEGVGAAAAPSPWSIGLVVAEGGGGEDGSIRMEVLGFLLDFKMLCSRHESRPVEDARSDGWIPPTLCTSLRPCASCRSHFSPGWRHQPGLKVPFEPGLEAAAFLAVGTGTLVPGQNMTGTNAPDQRLVFY
jgi:hypothetical protein